LWKNGIVWLAAPALWAGQDTLAAHADRAGAALRSGDYVTAEREYRLVIAEAPRMAEAYTNLGLSCHLQKKFTAAIEAFERGVELQPGMANAWLLLGIARFNINRPASALTALGKYSALRSGDFQGHYYTALCLLSLDRNRDAAAELSRALQIEPDNADALYHLAQCYLRMAELLVRDRGHQGADSAAFRELQQRYEETVSRIAAVDPNSLRIRQLRAGYYQAAGETEKAIDELRSLVATAPKVTGIYYTLGCLYLERREYDRAIAAFESELRLAAPFPRTYLQLGHSWMGKDEPARALPFLRQAAQQEPESGVPWVETGRAETKLGKMDDAVRSFLKAIELNEAKSSVYYLLGTAYRKAGNTESARAAFEKSRRLNYEEHTRIVDQGHDRNRSELPP
jgi:tetratricopeptide (TPR) repeat protein